MAKLSMVSLPPVTSLIKTPNFPKNVALLQFTVLSHSNALVHTFTPTPTSDTLTHWLFFILSVNTTQTRLNAWIHAPHLDMSLLICMLKKLSACLCMGFQSVMPVGHRAVGVSLQKSNQRGQKQQGSQQCIHLQGQVIRRKRMMKSPESERNVHPNMKIQSLSTHPHVSGNLSEVHTVTEPLAT